MTCGDYKSLYERAGRQNFDGLGEIMQDFIKEHGKEFTRTLTAVIVALAIAAPPAAQFVDNVCVSVEEVIEHVGVADDGG